MCNIKGEPMSKTTEQGYTAGPWTKKTGNGEVSIVGRYEFPPGMPAIGGYPLVCVMSEGDTCEANTQLIVRAVNSHNDLLEACKAAHYALSELRGRCSDQEWNSRAVESEALKACEKAIAKATGGV